MGVWVTFPLIHLDQQLTGVFAAVQHLQRGRGLVEAFEDVFTHRDLAAVEPGA